MSDTYYKDEGLNLAGVFVGLDRSKEGKILIEIETEDLQPIDLFPLGVPILRLSINDHVFETRADGSLQPVAE